MVREGNAAISEEDRSKYDCISSFNELMSDAIIDGETPAKRQEADEEDDVEDDVDDDDDDEIDDVEAIDDDDDDDVDADGDVAEDAAEES